MDFEFRGAASIMALIKVDRGVIEAACLRTLVHENNVVRILGEFNSLSTNIVSLEKCSRND